MTMLVLAMAWGLAPVSAQSVWTSADMDVELTQKLDFSAGAEFRSLDEFAGAGRWSANVGLGYRWNKYFSMSGGYSYIHQQVDDRLTTMGNFIPAYWQPRHRGYLNLTGRYRWNRFTFSLRERYQYTYRTEQYVPKFESDRVTPKEDEWVEGSGRNVLRSRVKVDYNIRKSPLKPYASCEFYHSLDRSFELAKTRWTVGASYRINKRHSVELYYRYIDEADEEEDNGHVIGLGYRLSL